METTTLPRNITLTDALQSGLLPILSEVHHADGGSTRWVDYGDEQLDEVYLAYLHEVAAARDWDAATVLWVDPSPARQPHSGSNTSGERLRAPLQDGPSVREQFGFGGYYLTLLEPGADPRPATLLAGLGGRVGATPAEASEATVQQQRAWWDGLEPQKQAVYRLQDIARRRRWNRGEAEALDQELRETVLDSLAAGMLAPQIAQATGLSRERVYQIRDGRR